jgi:hypothetical protein
MFTWTIRGILFFLLFLFLNPVSGRYLPPKESTGTWYKVSGNVLDMPINRILTVRDQAFPRLIDATVDSLIAGLESKLFTSMDLVHVGLQSSSTKR